MQLPVAETTKGRGHRDEPGRGRRRPNSARGTGSCTWDGPLSGCRTRGSRTSRRHRAARSRLLDDHQRSTRQRHVTIERRSSRGETRRPTTPRQPLTATRTWVYREDELEGRLMLSLSPGAARPPRRPARGDAWPTQGCSRQRAPLGVNRRRQLRLGRPATRFMSCRRGGRKRPQRSHRDDEGNRGVLV